MKFYINCCAYCDKELESPMILLNYNNETDYYCNLKCFSYHIMEYINEEENKDEDTDTSYNDWSNTPFKNNVDYNVNRNMSLNNYDLTQQYRTNILYNSTNMSSNMSYDEYYYTTREELTN